MTTGPADDRASESPATVPSREARSPSPTLLESAWSHLRRDPLLAVPFAVAGLLLALADELRQRDPIPVRRTEALDQTISVHLPLYPSGTVRTARSLEALVDLRTPYALWAVGLELVVFFAVALAGWVTIRRALGGRPGADSLGRYLLLPFALGLVPRLLGSPTVDVGSLLVGLVLLAAFLFVGVRLFLVPGFLVAGRGFTSAFRESVQRSRGRGWTLFGLVLFLGVASWGLALVPTVGAFLSTAVVAPIHAVSIAVVVDEWE